MRKTRGIPSFRETERKNARANNPVGSDDI